MKENEANKEESGSNNDIGKENDDASNQEKKDLENKD